MNFNNIHVNICICMHWEYIYRRHSGRALATSVQLSAVFTSKWQRLGSYWKEIVDCLETDFQQDLKMKVFNRSFCI